MSERETNQNGGNGQEKPKFESKYGTCKNDDPAFWVEWEQTVRRNMLMEFYDEERTAELIKILDELARQGDPTALKIVASSLFGYVDSEIDPEDA